MMDNDTLEYIREALKNADRVLAETTAEFDDDTPLAQAQDAISEALRYLRKLAAKQAAS